MNSALRRMSLAVFAAFGIIVLTLTWIQGVDASRYRDDPRNARVSLGRAGRERGPITAADGVVLARSVADADDSQVFRRRYPRDDRYAHVVGYASVLFGDRGVEDEWAGTLVSRRNSTISGLLAVLTGGDLRPRGLRLSIDDGLQEVAATALGTQRGAVVAIDPRTGAVLAMVSSPSFDPSLLLDAGAGSLGDALEADPARPLVARAFQETYPPGSVFKIVTAAAAIEAGIANPGSRFADPVELALPNSTATIKNFDGEACAGGDTVTLETGFVRSCNTVFGQIGMDVGAERLVAQAEAFGFNAEIPFELGGLPSVIPAAESFGRDLAPVAQTALGQRDVRASALHAALIAGAVANNGRMMSPYVVAEVFNADGEVVDVTRPAEWRRAVSPATAAVLAELMERAVASGTGRRAAVSGIRVAGKTGTAEVPDAPPHAWFAGFGPVAAGPDERQIAVAVVVESGGDLREQATGGVVAAPIAAEVIAAWLQGST